MIKEATLEDLVSSEFDRTSAEKVIMNVGTVEDRKSGAPPHVQSTPRCLTVVCRGTCR